ncbi:MAG: MFS transporter [Clostridiales bacterium]|nr:MFS transporter [Clostridiales bacterium]
MSSILMKGFSAPPSGRKSLAAQLSFCFVVTLIILFIVSSIITTTYVSVLERQRAEAIKAVALSSGLNLSGTAIQDGMVYPLPIFEYDRSRPYVVNIYLSAGNSFVRVYSSVSEDEYADGDDNQYILEDAGKEYKKAFDQMTVELSSRSEDETAYITAVAPIVGAAGSASGIIEVMMPEKDFHGTVNGFSLSWVFTIISIALSIAIVFYYTHKMLLTVFSPPNRHLPKVIRYGFAGCETIAFFSSMGCVIPPLVISQFIKESPVLEDYPSYIVQGLVAGSFALYSVGFFGFRSLRVKMFNRLSARVTLVISVVASFVLLLLNGVFSHPAAFIALQLPIAFGLGMLFFFQREYRVYAGRLGHEGFEERTIQKKQLSSQVLGAAVGAVMAGIIFDRFGLLAALLTSGVFIFIVTILAMLFVQHCPSSNEPSLRLSTFMYAISNQKSGTFLISAVLSAGMQLSFFVVFIPNFLGTVGISLATVSFYYMLFALCCCVLVRLIVSVSNVRLTVVSSLWISALFQLVGYITFALLPTAKMLVFSVVMFGLAMGLQGFNYLLYYTSLIREEKRSIASVIFERSFANGVTISAVLLTVALMLPSIRISLLVYCLICAAVLLAYPIISLVKVQSQTPEKPPMEDPFAESEDEWSQPENYSEYDEEGYGFFNSQGSVGAWEDEDEIITYEPGNSDWENDLDEYGGDKWV